MKATKTAKVRVGDITFGGKNPLVLIAGPCVIHDWEGTYNAAKKLKKITSRAGLPLIFKASFDKANRTSIHSFRGPGLKKGLEILYHIRQKTGIPVLSDVHRFEQIEPASEVLDILQIPAFLCRQTDFVMEVARSGKTINVKKGQFLAPYDVEFLIEKVTSTGNHRLLITERGCSFGYNNLVVDMRSLVILKDFGYPVVFDATHSVQLPGAKGVSSGGERRFIAPLSMAAVAIGVDALFLEVHEDPDKALCDGPNSVKISDLPFLLRQITRLADLYRST